MTHNRNSPGRIAFGSKAQLRQALRKHNATGQTSRASSTDTGNRKVIGMKQPKSRLVVAENVGAKGKDVY